MIIFNYLTTFYNIRFFQVLYIIYIYIIYTIYNNIYIYIYIYIYIWKNGLFTWKNIHED